MRLNFYSIKQVKEKGINYNSDNLGAITTPSKIDNIARKVLKLNECDVEKCYIFTLNTQNKIAGIHLISQGTLNSSLVHPREIFKHAILNNANSIILLHNHPSGDTTPSNCDNLLTKRIKEAGEILGIKLIDHLIVGNSYYSYSNEKSIL